LDLLLKSYTTIQNDSATYYLRAAEPLIPEKSYSTQEGYLIQETKEMYFRDEIHRFKERFGVGRSLVLLDGGAYNGDTLLSVAKGIQEGSLPQVEYAYAFEPDPINYSYMQRILNNLPFTVETFNCGLDDHDGKEQFCWEGVRTRINTDGGIFGAGETFDGQELPVINTGTFLESLQNRTSFQEEALSSFSKNQNLPNFIKLDIEGREREAILSAAAYIRNHHPDLAISIYHRPEDLWDIPLMIYSICDKYKIYIRHNTNYYTETVCHAICE
jgi:FkbM family methyltransferase